MAAPQTVNVPKWDEEKTQSLDNLLYFINLNRVSYYGT